MANIVFDFLHNYETGERRESEPANAYQYDEGHVLEAILPAVVTTVELHYWIRGMEEAEAYTPTSITPNADGSCTILGNIPNKYFETNGELRIYIVVTDDTASITTYEGKLYICQRSMPDDYVDDDPENEATRVLTEARAAAATATAAAERCEKVLESIPADYSQLSDDVDTLKEDLNGMNTATSSDVGKALKAKTVTNGKVTEWEFGEAGSGLTEDIKQALLQIAEKVAYIDDDGQDYYDALHSALYPPKPATGISLNQSALSFGTLGTTQQLTATVTPADSSDAVTWTSSNQSVATVSSSGLVTSIAYGTATITATAGSVSATCSVTIAQATLTSISAVYTQSGTVYDTDSLDSLKNDLVVTATWSDSSTSTVASTDYTLSGTLTAGTSTITVTYSGKTTTFTVTVSATSSAISVPLTIAKTIINMATGATTANNSWYASDFVEIPTGMTEMKYSNGAGENVSFRGAFYDSSNSYVSSSLSSIWSIRNGSTGTVNIPSTAKYIRLSTNTGSIQGTTITLTASAT